MSSTLLQAEGIASGQARGPEVCPEAPVRIVLAGDSTVNSEGGWGASLRFLLGGKVECINMARNGRSSKSYYDEGLWREALAQGCDYVLIQFGHNDMPGKGLDRETDPQTTYVAHLRRYVSEAREAGVKPVLVTSLSRRNYQDGHLIQDLAPYVEVVRRVAREEGVPLVDLNRESVVLLSSLTQEQADRFNAVRHPDDTGEGADRTHLNALGAAVFGRMVYEGLIQACPELGQTLR